MSQTERIVNAIARGDKPNHYFPTIMRVMNYTARISEARQKGYNITAYKKDDSATVWYRLETNNI